MFVFMFLKVFMFFAAMEKGLTGQYFLFISLTFIKVISELSCMTKLKLLDWRLQEVLVFSFPPTNFVFMFYVLCFALSFPSCFMFYVFSPNCMILIFLRFCWILDTSFYVFMFFKFMFLCHIFYVLCFLLYVFCFMFYGWLLYKLIFILPLT